MARLKAAVQWRLEARTRGLRRTMRAATAGARVRPTFLVIGAQKAGTTSLHVALGRHPSILLATDKEVHYFSLGYAKGERWYRSLPAFSPAPRILKMRARRSIVQ